MASWRIEYFEALKARESHEHADAKLFEAYTRLADRTAAVEASCAKRSAPSATKDSDQKSLQQRPRAAAGPSQPTEGKKKNNADTAQSSSRPADSDDELSEMRRDLAEAQRTKTDVQSRLRTSVEELERLRARTKGDAQRISELSAARTTLTTRVRDRDEELKGKAKLLEDVQDEVISLNIELNMAEKRCKGLESENQELVARLMAWKGQEADAVNNASKFS